MSRTLAAAAVAALALAGCGGDEKQGPAAGAGDDGSARTTDTAPRTDSPPRTETALETQPKPEPPEAEGGAGGSPEDQPGGAGDEVPARSQALLTGRAGRITPRRVRVPPFISVRLELRSADGRRYGVRVNGRRVGVSGGVASTSTTLPGLRPGRAYLVHGTGGSRIRIEASAEPGP